ncbi:GAF domain-containing protein, partial [Burkholderia cenocepacia]|uniref:GAF domain-containing protein n=1 Tax=Burkholderia cenocepacia TaxID=95486 RepID=UPI00406C7B44
TRRGDPNAQIRSPHTPGRLRAGEGVLLHSIDDEGFEHQVTRVWSCDGVSCAEGARGTDAIGTLLASGKAVVVHGYEHFLRANHILTCACAPIVDPCGRTPGTRDVRGYPRGLSPHSVAPCAKSGQPTENDLAANDRRQCARLPLCAPRYGVEAPSAGLV